jgi:putative SOS response-associated peptidase YedK
MCYYNGQKVTKTELIRLMQLEKIIANIHLDNILIDGFNYGNHTVLKRLEGQEDFELVEMEWGFIPSWIKTREELFHFRRGGTNPTTGKYDKPFTTLNAIGEEMLDKQMYAKAARQNRCLILSSGFYEWRHIFPKNKKTGLPLKTAIKYPYFIHVPDQEYFFMAGIYNIWTDKTSGETVNSSAIVTAPANELMVEVHNNKKRMPVILPDELAYEWLFGELDDERIKQIAGNQFPHEKMVAHSIAKDFQSSVDPTAPFYYPDLLPLLFPKYQNEQPVVDEREKEQGRLFK